MRRKIEIDKESAAPQRVDEPIVVFQLCDKAWDIKPICQGRSIKTPRQARSKEGKAENKAGSTR